jgi:hypothetical protein
MAEAWGTVHTLGKGLLRGWWWPVGPKLVFDQMAAPVPEIINGSLYICFFSHHASDCTKSAVVEIIAR